MRVVDGGHQADAGADQSGLLVLSCSPLFLFSFGTNQNYLCRIISLPVETRRRRASSSLAGRLLVTCNHLQGKTPQPPCLCRSSRQHVNSIDKPIGKTRMYLDSNSRTASVTRSVLQMERR